jgi:hypothetical protein
LLKSNRRMIHWLLLNRALRKRGLCHQTSQLSHSRWRRARACNHSVVTSGNLPTAGTAAAARSHLLGGIMEYSVSAWQLSLESDVWDALGTLGRQESERAQNCSCYVDNVEPALRQKSSSTALDQSNHRVSDGAQDNNSRLRPTPVTDDSDKRPLRSSPPIHIRPEKQDPLEQETCVSYLLAAA